MPLLGQDENLPPNQTFIQPKISGNSARKFGNSTLNLDIASTPRSGITKALIGLNKAQLAEDNSAHGILTPPASQSISTSSMLSPPPETQLEEQRRTKALQLSANNKRPRAPHASVPGSPTPIDTPNPRTKKHSRQGGSNYEDTTFASPTPGLSKRWVGMNHKRTSSEASLTSPEKLLCPETTSAYLSPSRIKGRRSSRSSSPTPSRARSRTPVVHYSPPRENFTPPREVMSPAPTRSPSSVRKQRTKQEKAAAPTSSRPKGKQARASLPPPDLETIDLTMPLPPASPSEDPILLKGKPSQSKLSHSTPIQRRRGKRRQNSPNSTLQSGIESAQMSTLGIFSGVDDTFAYHPRRGARPSFKDLSQVDADEREIENPDWILSDPPMPTDMNVFVEPQASGSTEVRMLTETQSDWGMGNHEEYFDVYTERGFGSDDDNDDVPQAKVTDDRSEIVPSSDAEEEDQVIGGRGNQAATPVTKLSPPPRVDSPGRVFTDSLQEVSLGPVVLDSTEATNDKEAPFYDDYEVPLAGDEGGDTSLGKLRPGSPHPNKSTGTVTAMSEGEDDDEENNGSIRELYTNGKDVVRRRTLSEMEEYIESKRRGRSPPAIRATFAPDTSRNRVDVSDGMEVAAEDIQNENKMGRTPTRARTLSEMEEILAKRRLQENGEVSLQEVVKGKGFSVAQPSDTQKYPVTDAKLLDGDQTLDDTNPSPTLDLSIHFDNTVAPDATLQGAIKEARERRDSRPGHRFNLESFQTPIYLSSQSLPFIDLNATSSPKPAISHTLKHQPPDISLPPIVSLRRSPAVKERAAAIISSDESPEEDDGIEIESHGLVKISSRDSWAAARAAAILKQHHDYEEDIYRSRAHARRRLSQSPMQKQKKAIRIRNGVSKRGSPSVLENVRSPAMLRELLHEAELSVTGGSPRASSVFSERSTSPFYAPSLLSVSSQADYTPVPGEWRKSDWKALDRCFTDERLLKGQNGLMADLDGIELEAVVERYLAGIQVVDTLGSEWSTERLLRRVHALKDRQRAGRGAPPTPSALRQMDSTFQVPWFTPTPTRVRGSYSNDASVPMTPVGKQLSFADIPETPMSTPILLPAFSASQYSHPKGEAGLSSKPLVNIDRRKLEAPLVNIVPPSTPASEDSASRNRDRERNETASPTRSVSSSVSAMSTPSGGVKGRVLSYVGSLFSRQTPNTARRAIPGPSALPRPSKEELGAIYPRGPVSTPPRPSIPHPVAPKDLVHLQHTTEPTSKLPVFKKPKTPKRLVELNHIPPPPGTLPRIKRKVSTGSVRDIVRAFEEKDRERANSTTRKSSKPAEVTRSSAVRLRATSSMGDIRNTAAQKSAIPARTTKPLDPITRPRWRL